MNDSEHEPDENSVLRFINKICRIDHLECNKMKTTFGIVSKATVSKAYGASWLVLDMGIGGGISLINMENLIYIATGERI